MSRSAPGIAAWKNAFSGQSICRVRPSTSETCGRVAWKSKKPSESISANRVELHCFAR